MRVRVYQYIVGGSHVPPLINSCMDRVRAWCWKKKYTYQLYIDDALDMRKDAQSDLYRAHLFATHKNVIWFDWDACPLDDFDIADLSMQWQDEDRQQAIMYSPDCAPWRIIYDQLRDYYASHPGSQVKERGRFWKIANSCKEYKPNLFSKHTYNHLFYTGSGLYERTKAADSAESTADN